MSLLEKIIWLADYIEPTRTMPGVDKLRLLAQQDLDSALRKAMQGSLEHVERKGKRPHPATAEALKDLKKKDSKP